MTTQAAARHSLRDPKATRTHQIMRYHFEPRGDTVRVSFEQCDYTWHDEKSIEDARAFYRSLVQGGCRPV